MNGAVPVPVPVPAPPRGTFLREPRQIIAALRVLVLAGLAMLGLSAPPHDAFMYWFLVTVYGVTNVGYLWARNRDFSLRRVKWIVFLFDVVVVSALIVARGEQVQSFITAYFGLVLMAAAADGLGNAFVNAILVGVVHAAVTRWGTSLEDLLSFGSLSTLVFFFVIAVFMGHTANEARGEARERARAEASRQAVQEALLTTSSVLSRSTEELRATRESLRANDRLATLGMLSAGIAHEMKNPLAAIAGSVEPGPEILDEIEAAAAAGRPIVAELAELRSIFADCELAAGHLRRIAGDLTGLVRTGPSQASAVDPAELLESAGRMLKAKSRSPFRLVLRSDSRRPVRVDASRMLQVLLNLGANGIDAMEGREDAVLTLAAEDAGADRVVFLVEDTGTGIAEEVLARLYEPFVTTKGPGRGTGLGLHLVSEIVAANNGRIDCSTRPGEGTRFRVDLPAAIEAMAPAHGTTPKDEDHDERTQDAADRGRRGDHPQGVASHAPAGAV